MPDSNPTMPLFVRKNTAFFDFSEVPGGVPGGEFWFSGSHDFLRYLDIPDNEIDINEYRKEVIVKFESDAIFAARIEQFGGSFAFRHPNGTTYQVLIHGRLAAPRRTSVRIKWVPQEMELDILRRELEPFGKVEGMSRVRTVQTCSNCAPKFRILSSIH